MEAEYKVIEMVSPKIPMFNMKPTFQIPFLIGSPDKFPGFAPHVWKVTAGCLSWKRTRYLQYFHTLEEHLHRFSYQHDRIPSLP